MTVRNTIVLSSIVAAAATVFSCAVTHTQKRTSSGAPEASTKKLLESDLDTANSAADYAALCKQELGLPAATLAAWNCLDGAEIPITIDGKKPTKSTYDKMKKQKGGCDLPSWFGDEPCAGYAFVHERQLSKDVTGVLFCRLRDYSSHLTRADRQAAYQQSKTEANFEALYQFDSIGLIWTNRQTGHTCYFDYVGASYGGHVPSPDQKTVTVWDDLPDPKPPTSYKTDESKRKVWERSSDDMWKKPKDVAKEDNCVRCHDSGPFKASPWISQVYKVPSNDRTVPHIVVGKVFGEWKERYPMVAISTEPVPTAAGKTEPQSCTSCHRLGSQANCSEFIQYSIGKGSPVELSEFGKSFFYRTWMPPPPDAWHNKLESELTTMWNDSYGKHVEFLSCCCKTPNARGCLSQRFDSAPIPEPTLGTGPSSCIPEL